MNWFQRVTFLKSAHSLTDLTEDIGQEIAFVGRSNAGKSSALNTIVGKSGLARASKTPGRTQLINFFSVSDHQRLVDLPGYGYAKVPQAMREHWHQTLGKYLETRQSLVGLCVIMDIRHPLKAQDWQMLNWAQHRNLAIHCLLTKADKLSRGAAQRAVMEVRGALTREGINASVQAFSATARIGVDEARTLFSQWLAKPDKSEPT
ncbi:MAG TPA: YihA family ribosome biogenesis GTP-binding protein [Halothiobacillus sp.]|nr:YihA family ribosome biogenesis GTP-binding protein [Halothiobacillus sp.]